MNKPGVKTTEFWVTVLVQVIGVILALGVVTPEQSDTLTKAVTQGGGIVAMLISAFAYNKGRAAVKAGEAAKAVADSAAPLDTHSIAGGGQ